MKAMSAIGLGGVDDKEQTEEKRFDIDGELNKRTDGHRCLDGEWSFHGP